jgi:hypothetical protein
MRVRGGADLKKHWVRMGDGFLTEMSEAEIERDLELGTQDASEESGVPTLTENEIKYLFETFTSRPKVTGVEVGNEVMGFHPKHSYSVRIRM